MYHVRFSLIGDFPMIITYFGLVLLVVSPFVFLGKAMIDHANGIAEFNTASKD